MKDKITEKTTLAEVLKNPKSQDIMAKYSVPCLTCPFAQMEMEKLKIGEICKMYGLNAKGLLKELNEV